MNGEVIQRLLATFPKAKGKKRDLDPTDDEVIDQINSAWDSIEDAEKNLKESLKHLRNWNARISALIKKRR